MGIQRTPRRANTVLRWPLGYGKLRSVPNNGQKRPSTKKMSSDFSVRHQLYSTPGTVSPPYWWSATIMKS